MFGNGPHDDLMGGIEWWCVLLAGGVCGRRGRCCVLKCRCVLSVVFPFVPSTIGMLVFVSGVGEGGGDAGVVCR